MDIKELQAAVKQILEPDFLWSEEKIMLKLTEELGELAKANRKGSPLDQWGEAGDLFFSLLALTLRKGFNIERLTDDMLAKFTRLMEAERNAS